MAARTGSQRDAVPAVGRSEGDRPVCGGQGLTFGTPVAVPVEGTIHPTQQRNYDVMPDGKRLLVVLRAAEIKAGAARETSAQINVVLNWFEELRTRVRAK